MNRLWKANLENCRERLSLLKEYLSSHEQNVGRSMDVKGYSERSWMEMRNVLLETRGKAILTIKWQRAWLNCVHVLMFCGKYNF